MSNSSIFASYPSLKGRVVLVTGGASGIGEAIVTAFAMQGSKVAFLDIQNGAAEKLVSDLAAQGFIPPTYYPCDLTDVDALQRTVAQVLDKFSTVDVLVNNAANDTRHSIEEVTSTSWDQSIAINLKPQFFMAQGVIPAMKKEKHGSIINMSSISWMIPSIGLPMYITAKAAIVGMTRTLAHELGPDNIRVNAVLPGSILTERQKKLWLTPEYETETLKNQALKRLLQPDEVARLVLFLASDDSSAITSQSYVIDGGWV